MPKPGFRLFILPLGAVSMIATLSSQHVPQVQRESLIQQMRQEIVDCPSSSTADVCVIRENAAR